MLTLYDFMGSGNGYKVRLLLAQLGVPYRLVECDILKGETHLRVGHGDLSTGLLVIHKRLHAQLVVLHV